jgi:ankyrin repeat protein
MKKIKTIEYIVVAILLLGIITTEAYATPDEELLKAIEESNVQAVQGALQQGANPNTRVTEGNLKGLTALMLAVAGGDLQAVQLLLQYKADANIAITEQDYKGVTALMIAVGEGNIEIIKLLLEHNADVNMAITEEGFKGVTPLMIAVGYLIEQGNVEIVKLLLEHNADVNMAITEEGFKGVTPLMIAVGYLVEQGNVEIVKLLLEHNANVNMSITKKGFMWFFKGVTLTPLMIAAEKGNVEIVKLLLEHNADLNATLQALEENVYAWKRKPITDVLIKAKQEVEIDRQKREREQQLSAIKAEQDRQKREFEQQLTIIKSAQSANELYIMGYKHEKTHPQVAIAAYQEILERFPNADVALKAIDRLDGLEESENPHLKRGREWKELKEYDKARDEFSQVITEEPKNVEARYLMAESYYQENDFLQAIKWAQETLSMELKHDRAEALLVEIRKKGIEFLNSSDPTVQLSGLQIIEKLPSQEVVSDLKAAIGSQDNRIALKAESLLKSINPNELRSAWIALLQAPNASIQEKAAEKLWALERFPEAAQILRPKYVKLFMEGNETAGDRLVELGAKEAVPDLKIAIGSQNERIVLKAESLLKSINPDELWSAWIALLQTPNASIQEKTAEKLWALERFPEAGQILRAKYAKLFMKGDEKVSDRLIELGFKEAVPTFLEAIQARVNLKKAVTILVQYKESQVVPILIHALSEKFSGKHREDGCKDPYLLFAWALGQLEAKEAVPILKEVLSNIVTIKPDYTDCVNSYLEVLATLDGEAWKTFPYWLRGGSEYNYVMSKLADIKNGNITPGARDYPIDTNSPNAKKIYEFLDKLGHCDSLSGCEKGLDFLNYDKQKRTFTNYVKVDSPTEMEYFGNIQLTRTETPVGSFTLVLRATGDPERAWVVVDVKDVELDETRITLGQAFDLYKRDKYAEAFKLWSRAAEQGHAEAQYYLGVLYQRGLERGRGAVEQNLKTAIEWYRKAADQGDARGQNSVAWIYATSKDLNYQNGEKAVDYALKAVRQEPDNSLYHNTLAAAYARNGQFQESVKAQEKAIDLLPNDERISGFAYRDILESFQKRLELYRQNQAYTEEK